MGLLEILEPIVPEEKFLVDCPPAGTGIGYMLVGSMTRLIAAQRNLVRSDVHSERLHRLGVIAKRRITPLETSVTIEFHSPLVLRSIDFP